MGKPSRFVISARLYGTFLWSGSSFTGVLMRVFIEELEARRIFSAVIMDSSIDGNLALAHFPKVEAASSEPGGYQAWINWGDGRESRGFVNREGEDLVVTGIACYPQPGTYNVHVTLTATPEDEPPTVMSADVVVQSEHTLLADAPHFVRHAGDYDIYEMEGSSGQKFDVVGGDWIVSLAKPLPGYQPVYMGWDQDYPDTSNYYSVLQPSIKAALDQTGLSYEWGGYLGSGDVFLINVDPALSQRQVHEALKGLPGYFAVEPNGIMTGWEMEVTPYIPPAPADPAESRAPTTVLPPASSPPAAASVAGVASFLFSSDEAEDRDLIEG